MRRAVAVCALVVALGALGAPAAGNAESEAVGKAQEAAKAWLALVDAGKYGASWDAAAAFFRSSVPRAKWEAAVDQVRGSLGAVKSRKLKNASFTRKLPNVPEGEYVVIQYDTDFAYGVARIETVTPMREKDGSWKVSGYFVR